MRHFIFLEFLDPIVESTLRELRDALQCDLPVKSPVHVTLRGPYRSPPPSSYMRELSERLRGKGVRIIGAGMFSTPKGFAIFLRAESAAFPELWWKPDFQRPLDEIEPHLTVFETKDRASALLVLNFLRAAKISILTYAVQLSLYTSGGQSDLFGSVPVVPVPPNASLRRDIVAIDPEVLPRARSLGKQLTQMRTDRSQFSSKP